VFFYQKSNENIDNGSSQSLMG